MNLKDRIINAITIQKLSLNNEGVKYWYKYKLRITKLFWSRNIFDGYLIEIYDRTGDLHLGTIYYP